jgi:hypothetical protein
LDNRRSTPLLPVSTRLGSGLCSGPYRISFAPESLAANISWFSPSGISHHQVAVTSRLLYPSALNSRLHSPGCPQLKYSQGNCNPLIVVETMGSLPQTSQRASFWQKYLANAESCIFPTLIEQSARPTDSWRTKPIDASLFNRSIANLCSAHDVSITELCVAAWAVLLGRYLAADHVCFGLTFGRAGDQQYSACRTALLEDRLMSSIVIETKESLESCLSFSFQSTSEFQSVVGPENRLFNTSVRLDYDDSGYPRGCRTVEVS